MLDTGRRSSEGSGLARQFLISLFLFFGAALLPGLIFGGYHFITALVDSTLPTVRFIDPPPGIGIEPTTLSFDVIDTGAGLDEVFVRAVENKTARQLFHRKYPDDQHVSKDTIAIPFDGKASGYAEGHTSLLVNVVDRSLWQNRTVTSMMLKVDYDPPRVKLLSGQMVGEPGSLQTAFFRVRDRQIDFTGVRVGAGVFPGFPAQDLDRAFSQMEDPDVYFTFFPIPLHCNEKTCKPELIAVDSVGNQATSPLRFRYRTKRRATRIIKLEGEELMGRISSLYVEYLQQLQIGQDYSLDISPAPEQFSYRFQKLNEEYREFLDEGLLKLFKNPKTKRLWRGPFLGFAGEVIAKFGDAQHWSVNGLESGRGRSYGITWGRLKDDRIRAANAGAVVFTGPLGVYGNTVVIDHGFGLSSLYAHLDSISCKVGDRITKSSVIGRAGSTGLVDQPSLFFQLRMHGVPIDPEPWTDNNWVRREIDRKISTVKRRLGVSGFNSLDPFG